MGIPRVRVRTAAPGATASPRLAWVVLACGAVGAGLYAVGPATLTPVLYLLITGGCIAAMVRGVVRNQPRGTRGPWTATVMGAVIFIVAAIVREALPGASSATISGPASHISDAVAVPGYLLFLGAWVAMLRRRRAGHDDPARADALLIGLAAAMAVWAFLIAPRIGAGHATPTLVDQLSAFFPMIDVVLLVIVAHIILAGGVRAPALWLFATAVAALFVGDLVYAMMEDTSTITSAPLQKAFDVLAIGAYVTLAAAASHPTMRTLVEPQPVQTRRFGALRTISIAAVVGCPTIIGQLSPPPNAWNLLVRIALSSLLTITIINRIVRAHGQRARAEQSERHRATHDALTDLPNRELLTETIRDWSRRAIEAGQEISLLFIDLDRFKRVNDSLGHEVGDELLVAVASRLSTVVRSEDLVCRIGGDEFVVALASDKPGQLAESLAARLVDVFAEPFVLAERSVSITASIGIARSAGASEALELIRDADTAMYKAKDSGGNTYARFDASLREQLRANLELEQALRGALARGELSVHYQPIVDLQSGDLTGVEALMRWTHPTLGMISPLQFIPIAEETGLIDSMGAWLLEEAAAQTVAWRAERAAGQPPLHVSVNLAVRQLLDPQIVDTIVAILDRTGLPASALWLEITESGAMQDLDSALRTLHRLRDLGITLCIDDFGTGYSSLSYIGQIPARIVKIDRSFVMGIGQSAESETIIRSVLAMADPLGREVVAEGVETQRQCDWLREQGCHYGQGYLFSAPRKASALQDWLHRPASSLARTTNRKP